jgi:DNA helicase-2/ATP-dependent DNA helicase PcrA
MITWDEGLLPEQRNAAMHIGSNAYLLAGPGTGKTLTLTRHICYLIDVKGVQPELICVLTFTRAAARELCQRVKTVVGHERMPKIFTLHSFALRQILRNSGRLTLVPQPLRIADDWEERNIILEDLKTLLGLGNINEARDLLNKLSADWQHLTVEKGEWEQRFANPAFLGAWREHREIYGYVLRAELVYQLKLALEQYDDFVLEGPPRYLLVDEYQDLNRCDLAVVKAIADTGAEIFAAGDDDQSIYGFRMAHPEGIRRFSRDYADACKLELEICKRCDQEILELGLFVACQDYARLRKPLRAEDGRQGAEIALLRFQNQFQEAQGIALLCRYLIYTHRVKPEQILILLRADRNGCFSSVIRQQLEQYVVPCNVATADTDPLNERTMRIVLSFLRLLENASDHLAWRTLLNQRDNRIGPGAINSVYQFARTQGLSFTEALINISNDPSLISERYGRLINAEVKAIKEILLELLTLLPSEEEDTSLIESLSRIINHLVNSPDERRIIQDHINKIIEMAEPNSIGDLLRAIQVSKEDIEQEIDEGKVNILTMHKAKGLTAEAVIIAAAEDEYLPGRAVGNMIGDERRLLYVSLTRAKHYLFITYCNSRTGQQRHTGRTSGNTRRSLTRFLQGAPITSQRGMEYILNLSERLP